MELGRLPTSPFEVRLAATLLLLLFGLGNVFGAWQVANFAAFTPRGVAATVAARPPEDAPAATTVVSEKPVSLAEVGRTEHRIHRELLVQDSHVHLPVYAMTAAWLSLLVLGLRLPSRMRSALILLAFGAPGLDFAGLWGAHLWPRLGVLLGTLAVAGGFAMGLAYLIVLVLTVNQCWLSRAAPS